MRLPAQGPLLAALIETLASLPATRGHYLAVDSQLNLAPPSVLQAWAGRVRALRPKGNALSDLGWEASVALQSHEISQAHRSAHGLLPAILLLGRQLQ